MNLSEAQLEALYSHFLTELKLTIENKYGSLMAFSKATGINRTSLSKVLSENIERDMSVEMYMRICKGLGLQGFDNAISESTMQLINGFPLKAYLAINNNLIMNSITLISNNLV